MRPYRRTLLLLAVGGLLVLLGFTLCAMAMIGQFKRRGCEASARHIGLALMKYRDAHGGRLPPPFIEDKDTGQRHSWRAMLLPYLISAPSVWERYSFQESWNSPRNREFLKFGEFACSAHSESPERTNYVAVVGENTLWPIPKKPRMWPAIVGRRGRPKWPNTIILVELVESDIPWTEPKDITLDEFIDTVKKDPQGAFYNKYVKGIRAIDASGRLRVIDPYDDVENIRKMFVVNE